MQALGSADVDTAVQMARVIGSSMARIAEAELSPVRGTVPPEGDPILAAEAFASMADRTIPAMARLLEFVWRRHLPGGGPALHAAASHGHTAGTSPVLAVGFADMVGFTLLSQHLTDEELAAVVRRFEEVSHDIVTGLGGRVVKMIGDEVMFVVDGVVDAARDRPRAGRGVRRRRPALRRAGRTVRRPGARSRDGDYYGPTSTWPTAS